MSFSPNDGVKFEDIFYEKKLFSYNFFLEILIVIEEFEVIIS
jgi:hypothetical protein